jgi:protein TonB
MFEQATLSNANAGRRAWTTGLGFAGEAAFVAFIALAPIIWPEVLPKPQALLLLLTPPAPVPPAQTTAVKPRTAQAPARIHFDASTLPRIIPPVIRIVTEEPPSVIGGIPGPGIPIRGGNSLIEGILGAGPAVPTRPIVSKKPEPHAETGSAEPRRIRTSSIELARLIHRVEPIYPYIAKTAHVSGTVELTAVVGVDGHIRELKVLSGSPLLIQAAIDAVRQWVYAPPILNGERVEVVAPITVKFLLNQ